MFWNTKQNNSATVSKKLLVKDYTLFINVLKYQTNKKKKKNSLQTFSASSSYFGARFLQCPHHGA